MQYALLYVQLQTFYTIKTVSKSTLLPQSWASSD